LIEDYRDRVKIFGTHFATLDIRQDSRIHQKVIDEIVEKYTDKDVSSLKNSEKVEILMTEILLLIQMISKMKLPEKL
jgi:phosphoenolpyruvate carboxylase